MDAPENGQRSNDIKEDEFVSEEVPKDFEPGACAESMLVATGSIEEMVEQEMDSSFDERQMTTSTISEIQEELHDCQLSDDDEDSGSVHQEDVASSRKEEATSQTSENDEDATRKRTASPSPSKDCWNSTKWKAHRKHVFILSSAGKPVYSRHGSEDKFVTIFGVMQALVSFVQDSQGDMIRSIHASGSHFVFLIKGPIILVSVSRTEESVPQLVLQLTYVYNQIVSVLTSSQLTRIYEQRRNYDLRRLLAGAERLIDSLLELTEREPAFLLGAVRCLPLSSTTRDLISNTISSTCSKIKNLVFAILIANNQLITLVRMKKYMIHPVDLHLIFNLINSSESFKTAESWTPICLPKFDPSGFLHGHVSYLSEDCQACLLLLTVDRDVFFVLSDAKQKIVERLRRGNCMEAINEAAAQRGLTVAQVGVPELRHFLYKSKSTAQFTSPSMEPPYHTEAAAEALLAQYQALHHRLHNPARPLKLLFYQLETDAMLGWMFLTRSEYDRGVNTFSPEGRLFQVEYAIEAIKLGSTAIGISTSEGIVLAVEKRITSPLMEPSTIKKIVEVDRHVGCAVSGLMADSRTLIDRARVEAQHHWFVYNEKMTVESVAQAVSNLAIQFGDSDDDGGSVSMSRPFGVAILFAGCDEKGPQLFHMDPSGTYLQFDAKAIGSGSEGAQQSLQEVYHKSMTLKEAINSALTILKQVMEEKLNSTNVELVTVTPDRLFHLFSKEEVEEVIKALA